MTRDNGLERIFYELEECVSDISETILGLTYNVAMMRGFLTTRELQAFSEKVAGLERELEGCCGPRSQARESAEQLAWGLVDTCMERFDVAAMLYGAETTARKAVVRRLRYA